MDGKIHFGIGYVSGRANVCQIINNTYKHLINQTEKFDKEVEITIFILFDLIYQKETTREDFYNIESEVFDNIKVKYITPEDIENYKKELTEKNILTDRQANLLLGYGYARARNTLLYKALKENIDYFLFWDDDEYPVACVKNEDNPELEWTLQDNIITHLKYIQDADVTFGYRCGYNSPLPYMNLNDINEEAFRAYVESVKNEFTTWEQVRSNLLENEGITYADKEIATGRGKAHEMQCNGSHKWVSGSPLCLNLRNIDKIPAFYNPNGARGEDTFFSLLVDDLKIVQVPVYHFHDAFLKYTDILKNKYPKELFKIQPNDINTIKRFFNVSRGWIKYRPLYLYITNNEHYREEIELTKQNLKKSLPEINKMFAEVDFNILLEDLEEYDKNVESDYQDFIEIQNIWSKLKSLKNNE